MQKEYEKDQQIIKSFDNCTANFYKTILLIQMNIHLYAMFLLSICLKQEMNLFYKYEYKNKTNILYY